MQRKDTTRPDRSGRKFPESRRDAEETINSIRRENHELRKTLARADAILDSLPSVFAVIQGGKIREITGRALETLGYGREEVQGMEFAQLIHTRHRSAFLQDRNFGDNGSPEPQEIDLLTREGEAVGCDFTLHRITYQGRAAFLAELALSGPRRERERNLISAHKDDLIAVMSAGLARKLTPSVRALSDYVARQKTRGPLNPPLVAAANELVSLTRCLETLSRDEPEPSRVIPFDLGKVVEEAISILQGNLDGADGRATPIHFRSYSRQASPVIGDPEEIRNAVMELITNAVEAMPRGGDLYITTEESAGYACVYIQDSGSSVPEEHLPKVMDPFFTTKGSDGLGLCMARAALKRHHGDLQLESGKGRGTTITLRMPLTRKAARQGKQSRKRRDLWILIIEGDHLVRELLFQVLSSKGYNVDTAEVFSDGFDKVRSRAFDLVIAGTAAGDAQSMVRRIRKAAPRAGLALIGDPGSGDPSGRIPPGSVDLVIGKPIDMGWTLTRISELLIGRAR
jgi:two-component system sporulation sensor kinase C